MASCALCVQHEIAFWRAMSGVWRLCDIGQIEARRKQVDAGTSPTRQRDVVFVPRRADQGFGELKSLGHGHPRLDWGRGVEALAGPSRITF